MAGPQRRRTYWRGPEIAILVECIQRSPMLRIIMGSTSISTIAVYKEVSRTLKQSGFERTAEQARAKIKQMKVSFYNCLQAHDGNPPQNKRCTYFEEMHSLWVAAGQPSWLDRRPDSLMRRALNIQRLEGKESHNTPPRQHDKEVGVLDRLREEEEEAEEEKQIIAERKMPLPPPEEETVAELRRQVMADAATQTQQLHEGSQTDVSGEDIDVMERMAFFEDTLRMVRLDITQIKAQIRDMDRSRRRRRRERDGEAGPSH